MRLTTMLYVRPARPQISLRIRTVGTVIESEVRPTGMQLKRKAKLPTVIGLTTKHAVSL